MAEAPTLADICQALRVEPGQTLVIRLNPELRLTREQFDEFSDRAKEAIPGVRVVVIVADEIAVVETTS